MDNAALIDYYTRLADASRSVSVYTSGEHGID
jgi:hypothetical protein